jgi:hypothetical protein
MLDPWQYGLMIHPRQPQPSLNAWKIIAATSTDATIALAMGSEKAGIPGSIECCEAE